MTQLEFDTPEFGRKYERLRSIRYEAGVGQKVYFIGTERGAVKIGIARDPTTRLRALQTGHHEPLKLLATCNGGRPLEREYHLRFAESHLHGEWFSFTSELGTEIRRHQNAIYDEMLEDWIQRKGPGAAARVAAKQAEREKFAQTGPLFEHAVTPKKRDYIAGLSTILGGP